MRARNPDLIVMDLRIGWASRLRVRSARAGRPAVRLLAAPLTLNARYSQSAYAKLFQAADLIDTITIPDLKWRYIDADAPPSLAQGESRQLVSAQLVAPSPVVLQKSLDLARLGKLVRVEQRLELEQRRRCSFRTSYTRHGAA